MKTKLSILTLIYVIILFTACSKEKEKQETDKGIFEITVNSEKYTGTKVVNEESIGIRAVSAIGKDFEFNLIMTANKYILGTKLDLDKNGADIQPTITIKDKNGNENILIGMFGKVNITDENRIDLDATFYTNGIVVSGRGIKVKGFISK